MKKYISVLMLALCFGAFAAEECLENSGSELQEIIQIRYGDATCSAMKNFPDGDHPHRSYLITEKSYSLETAMKALAASCDDVVIGGKRTRVFCWKIICEYNCTETHCEEQTPDLKTFYKNKPKS